jgi:hypothetical protein
MLTSVVSYPERGRWGSAAYPGNCSGHLIKDLLDQFRPGSFLEVFAGGGTGRDVARDQGYAGSVHLDLNPACGGWNALTDEVPEGTEFTFLHPPYHSIIAYSGAVWGDKPHPDDLSRCGSYDEFLAKLDTVHAKVFSALRRGGRMAVLVGDVRRDGEFFSLQHDLAWFGTPEAMIIKLQQNTASSRRSYPGRFVAIEHETVLVFRKADWWIVPVRKAALREYDLRQSQRPTWRDLVQAALGDLGGEASLAQLYYALAGTERAARNPHWREKVRQVLQLGVEFEPVRHGSGLWRLVNSQRPASSGRPPVRDFDGHSGH